MLPSTGESQEEVEKWQKAMKVKNIVQWWPNQIHGFMTARGDLKDPAVEADYKKAYQLLLYFFHDNIGLLSALETIVARIIHNIA